MPSCVQHDVHEPQSPIAVKTMSLSAAIVGDQGRVGVFRKAFLAVVVDRGDAAPAASSSAAVLRNSRLAFHLVLSSTPSRSPASSRTAAPAAFSPPRPAARVENALRILIPASPFPRYRRPRESGGPERALQPLPWIPACAGLTVESNSIPSLAPPLTDSRCRRRRPVAARAAGIFDRRAAPATTCGPSRG